jgi:tetratricopeptide (TPR) repeat protein
MNVKPMVALGGALAVALALFYFTKTVKKHQPHADHKEQAPANAFDINNYIAEQKNSSSAGFNQKATELEEKLKTQTTTSQQVSTYNALAKLWKDSSKSFTPYAYYISNASKLENSEKNLTFAARLLLASIRGEKDDALLSWKTTEAIDLFERAIKLNPNNDELHIDLGSAYIFGKANSGDPQQTMTGITEILTVARKDSNNLRAQLMLGIGGVVSGQNAKAVERLLKVVQKQPSNAEAVAYLADAYAGLKNKAEATKWYAVSKRLINDPHYSAEVDERIKNLK